MNILKLSVLTFSVLLSSNALSQSPQNNEEVIKVLCANKVDKRELAYDKENGRWCDTTIVSLCSMNQRQAIKKVCNSVYKSRLASLNEKDERELAAASTAASEEIKTQELSDLKQEQVEIELKKVEIEQQKLELRKRELELLKQG